MNCISIASFSDSWDKTIVELSSACISIIIVLSWKMVFSTCQSQLLLLYFLVQEHLQFTLKHGVCA